jgi:hypothetical protein
MAFIFLHEISICLYSWLNSWGFFKIKVGKNIIFANSQFALVSTVGFEDFNKSYFLMW